LVATVRFPVATAHIKGDRPDGFEFFDDSALCRPYTGWWWWVVRSEPWVMRREA
jgi:hypothetical protein